MKINIKYLSLYRSIILIFMQIAINRMFTVEYLNLHANISGIAFHGCANADAVVGYRRQLKFEAIDEVTVWGLGYRLAAP